MAGIYSPDRFINVTAVDGTTQVEAYSPDGSWTVTTSGSGHRGVRHPSGALNITVVDGSKNVGAYAIDGSLNVFVGNGSPYGCLSVNDLAGSLSGGSSTPILNLNPLFAFDPQDLSSLFVERTSPVTAPSNGGTVGTMKDITTNGINAIASADNARPTLHTGTANFVAWDGSNDQMAFNGTGLVGTEYTIIAAFATPATPTNNGFVISGTAGANNQQIQLGWSDSNTLTYSHWGFTGANFDTTFTTAPLVLTAILNSSGKLLRLNGTQVASAISSDEAQKLTGFGGSDLGAFLGTSFSSMQLYRLASFSRALTGADLTQAETWAQEGFTT